MNEYSKYSFPVYGILRCRIVCVLPIGLLSKRVHVRGFLRVLLFLSRSLMLAPPGLALLYLALHRGLLKKPEGLLESNLREDKNTQPSFL